MLNQRPASAPSLPHASAQLLRRSLSPCCLPASAARLCGSRSPSASSACLQSLFWCPSHEVLPGPGVLGPWAHRRVPELHGAGELLSGARACGVGLAQRGGAWEPCRGIGMERGAWNGWQSCSLTAAPKHVFLPQMHVVSITESQPLLFLSSRARKSAYRCMKSS